MAAATAPAGAFATQGTLIVRPLAGIRVTDFTNHAAGPYCALMLALLGAEVVRIESRARLDIQRRPHPVYGRVEVPNFDHLAGHKKSITLNLKTPAGAELARELIAVSDAVVENYRSGVMARLGLGWDTLTVLNPRLVMLSLSAYGQEGPDSARPGYAPIFAAEGGLGSMTGYPDGPPGEIRNNMDHQAGLTAAFVLVTLLEERQHSGRGAYADLAAREVATMMVGESVVQSLAGHSPTRLGAGHPVWCPHAIYPTAGNDRWIAIAVRSDEEWQALVSAMGRPSWTEGLETEGARRDCRDMIDRRLGSWTVVQTGAELAFDLQSRGVCAEVSMSAQDLLEDSHLLKRGSITTVHHPEHGSRQAVEAPWRFGLADTPFDTWSPGLGEHNDEIICGLLGHDRRQLDRWIADQVVY